MAQFEQIAALERLMDTQVAMMERLVDQVGYLQESVLQLERTRVVRRSKIKKDGVAPPLPSSLPGGYCET